MSNFELNLNTPFISLSEIPRWVLIKGNLQTRVAINKISHCVVVELNLLGWESKGFEIPIVNTKNRCNHETKMQD